MISNMHDPVFRLATDPLFRLATDPLFRLATWRGSASMLHQRSVDGATAPAWEQMQICRPAVVLGSTQPDSIIDREAARSAGVDVARRRSGGGAVWLDPADSYWIDVTISRDDRRWSADIGHAFAWLGEHVRATLADLGVSARVHSGRLEAPSTPGGEALARLVCFASVGSGEVLVDGRKFVGMSQRRTRDRARFQLVFYGHFDLSPLTSLLRPASASEVQDHGSMGAVGVGCDELDLNPADLLAALIR